MKNRSIYRCLYPISFLYGVGVRLRNYLYNKEILKSKSYPIPIICIGNLSVGGSGKTPMVEYLIRHLGSKYRIAVVSRGYKRRSKGLVIALPNDTASQIGDEPRQILYNFPKVMMVLDGNRRRAIEYLLSLPKEEQPEIILLDDGFQHRRVLPSLSILLTDWNKPYIKDKLLPVGRLRESLEGALRADCIILTRCPEEIPPIEYRIMERNLSLYPHQSLLFSRTVSGDLTPLFPKEAVAANNGNVKQRVIAIAGIAQPEYFFADLKKRFNVIKTLYYPDHHHFSERELASFSTLLSDHPSSLLVLTQKDAVRIIDYKEKLPQQLKSRLYYIPIETVLSEEDSTKLEKIVEKTIRQVNQNSSLHL